ncbi:hypothetical protein DV872_13315 [Oceanispirochaeta sp. M1]|nr:hypothetical protein DV872_13315 [Oceanispirochaeta sp. M1]
MPDPPVKRDRAGSGKKGYPTSFFESIQKHLNIFRAHAREHIGHHLLLLQNYSYFDSYLLIFL